MVAGSILPVAWHNGKLYFLFGKENPMEDSAKGFSDFGGGVDSGETPFDTAMREGAEELTGFLGDPKQVRALVKRAGGPYRIIVGTYHVHIFAHPYDENLPKHYNQNHRFLWDRMDKTVLNDSKLFEKIEIQWFSPEEMNSRIKEFRGFYREIVQEILVQLPRINKFIQGKTRVTDKTKTRKNR